MQKLLSEDSESPEERTSRREFCKKSALLTSGSLLPFGLSSMVDFNSDFLKQNRTTSMSDTISKSIIGPYGPWLADVRPSPGDLSFRHPRYPDVETWKEMVLPAVHTYIARPELNDVPKVKVTDSYNYDGLEIEELEWSLPYGYPTKAVLLKPANAKGPLPAILGLHDHGGNKYFGLRKITKTSDEQHPLMKDHQEEYYEGMAWANEIAKKGYVVLVHDAFTFASRRVRYQDMEEIRWGSTSTTGKSDDHPEDPENIREYNSWAAAHEGVMAKSLFSGGTTWPGMFLLEDQIAVSILTDREEVDSERIGCAGLSGGGLRTVFLGGMDRRIKCAVCVGFMSTWDDFMLHKSFTHTWMTYVPILPRQMEFPEIFGMRMPLPTMVLNDIDDGLYTLPEMEKAVNILEENFAKAGAADKLSCRFYPGPHKFDAEMQKDAFDWFDRWLG